MCLFGRNYDRSLSNVHSPASINQCPMRINVCDYGWPPHRMHDADEVPNTSGRAA